MSQISIIQEHAQTSQPEDFDTYEEYLDSFISYWDMEYLENLDVARHLVELGLNVKVQIVSWAEFLRLKKLDKNNADLNNANLEEPSEITDQK